MRAPRVYVAAHPTVPPASRGALPLTVQMQCFDDVSYLRIGLLADGLLWSVVKTEDRGIGWALQQVKQPKARATTQRMKSLL